jgi:DNA-binding transcriptional MerR regulator
MTIAEVSKKFGVTADTLRYYERIGILPPVSRTKGGIRDYDEDSCRWIELMKCLRSAGVQIEALTEYSALYRQGDATMERRKEILVEQRAQLEARMGEIQNSLDRLNYKIANYEALLHGKDAPVQCIKA